MYDIKWKNDLDMYLGTFNNFVFEGNINDLQPVKVNEGYEYVFLKDAIAKEYCKDYCVVFYDHTRMSGKAITEGGEQDENNPENAPAQPDEKWFNSFIVYDGCKEIFASSGDKIASPNIALMLDYYRQDYLNGIEESSNKDLQGEKAKDMRRILDIMTGFDEKRKLPQYADAKPFMFILPDVSRFMTEPGRPKEKENNLLLMLFNATQVENTSCKLMLFVDKMNDLPAWFESENNNSSIKKVYIPMPDSKFREEFYRIEMVPVMAEVGQDVLNAKISKYSAYTENFSLKRLRQLRTFILEEEDKRGEGVPSYRNVNNIDKTVMRFEVGENKDPWRDSKLRERLNNLADSLGSEVKGQDAAINRVTDAVKSAALGISSSKKNDRRPRAIFFFAGPTGVGKTELSKQLSEQIFGNQDSMIRFDMSEFREEHTDARLFGAPPGYVGYEAGGELTKAIKQKPFSVVLFDEIEKAAPKIWDKFLQILGDGRLTDGKGETVSFTQSIIIFTSNLGITADAGEKRSSDRVANANTAAIDGQIKELIEKIREKDSSKGGLTDEDEGKKKVGESAEKPSDDMINLVREMKKLEKERVPLVGLTCDIKNRYLFRECYRELGAVDGCKYGDATSAFNAFVSECVKERISTYFEGIGRREVLGRIGEENILVFNFISEYTAVKIAENIIRKYCNNLREENDYHINLTVSDKAKEYITEYVKKPEVLNFGGRGIVSCVEKLMSVPVGKYMFDNLQEGANAVLDIYDGELYVEGV